MAFNSLVNSVMGMAFWLNSRTQEVIEVDPKLELHAAVVAKNPEKFGVSKSFVDNISADDIESGAADEELMNSAIKNGWIRVHVWGTGKEITFDVANQTRKILELVYDFCADLKKKLGCITNNTRITILPMVSGRTKEFYYSEMMDGSIFESKLNEAALVSLWFNPETYELKKTSNNAPDHYGMVSTDPEWFNIDPSTDFSNIHPTALALRNGFVRIDVMGDCVTFEIYKKPNSKMKDALSWVAEKLGNRGASTKVEIFIAGNNNVAYEGDLTTLLSTEIFESKLNEEIAAWWFNPKTNKFKEHPSNDHEVMVEKDPEWFGLDYGDLTGVPPKPLALQRGFVRIDVFPTFTHIEVDGKPNGRMKDALSLIAKKLYDYGMGDNYQITVAYDSRRSTATEYNGTLEQLYSTELFESVLNESVMKALWLDPKTLRFKSDHPEHRIMVEKDPSWFGLGGPEYKYSAEDPRNQALEKGFVRIDIFSNRTVIEIHNKPNGKMKDVLSWFAEKLLYDYSKSHKYKIQVYINSGNYEIYETDVDGLLTTSVFESKLSEMSLMATGRMAEIADEFEAIADSGEMVWKTVPLSSLPRYPCTFVVDWLEAAGISWKLGDKRVQGAFELKVDDDLLQYLIVYKTDKKYMWATDNHHSGVHPDKAMQYLVDKEYKRSLN